MDREPPLASVGVIPDSALEVSIDAASSRNAIGIMTRPMGLSLGILQAMTKKTAITMIAYDETTS